MEKILQSTDKSLITIDELAQLMPVSSTHTLSRELKMLEKKNKIVSSAKGITWIRNTNRNLRIAIAKGTQI
ncbi:MAG: hypothetical protein Q8R15_02760 [Candidatus Micrarchaeota archaeon]|nr:hypothetical protein [Candidatus Micrarchaeota archaeon]